MSSGKIVIAATLALAMGLGTYSFLAIRRTAGHRVALVDEISQSMPAIVGARLLEAWEPAPYADDVRAMYCLDDADAESGAGRVLTALVAAGWTMGETRRDPAKSSVVLTLKGPVQLKAGLAPGNRPDCDAAKHQMTLALDGSR